MSMGRRLDRVIDVYGRAVAQLDLARSDDDVAVLDAAEHRDLVAARIAGGDEGLVGDELGLALRVLALILDEEDGIAVGVIGDRRLRQGYIDLGLARRDIDGRVHAG